MFRLSLVSDLTLLTIFLNDRWIHRAFISINELQNHFPKQSFLFLEKDMDENYRTSA
jgi:hypothetical protein